MNGSIAFLRFVTKAALNYVGFGVAGDFVAEALPEMARDVYAWWAKGRSREQLQAEVQALALVDDEEARRLAADGRDPAKSVALPGYAPNSFATPTVKRETNFPNTDGYSVTASYTGPVNWN